MKVADIPSYRERCHREATEAVAFLLQRRAFIYFGEPLGCTWDDEGWVRDDADEGDGYLTGDELMEEECATEVWHTESIWLSREEATEFAKATEYNFPDGWRVYGMPSKGLMVDALKSFDARPAVQGDE